MKKKKIFMIISVLSIILFSMAIAPVELQNDTFYTIKIGEHIMKNGVDMQDPFSWHEDLIYTYPHWAYDVIIYLIYSLGGLTAIYISTVVLSVVLGLSIYTINVKLNKNIVVSFITTLGAIYCLENFIAARAQLVTFIIMIWVIFFIEKFLQKPKIKYAVCLIISFILVANLHAAIWPFFFVLFLPYIGEYICSIDYFYLIKYHKIKRKIKKAEKTEDKKMYELYNEKLKKLNEVKQRLEEKRENPYKIRVTRNKNIKWLIVVIILCALTGLLTPQNTFEPYTHLIKLMTGTTTNNISEHQPIVLADEIRFPVVFVLLIGAIGFLDNKIRLSDLFMIGGLSYLTITSRRQYSLLVLIGGVIFVRLVSQALEKSHKNITEKIMKELTDKIGVMILIVAVAIITVLVYDEKDKQIYVNEGSYPVHAAEYIKENLDLNEIRLFNEYNYGSYLLYCDIPVFIDSRADLYSPEFNGDRDIFRDFIDAEYGHKDYEEIFKKYGITHVILYKNSDLNSSIQKDDKYSEVYSDAAFVIYEKISK